MSGACFYFYTAVCDLYILQCVPFLGLNGAQMYLLIVSVVFIKCCLK